MVLFLMTSMPLVLVLLLTVYSPWRNEREWFLNNLFWGLKAFVPGILLYFFVIQFLSKEYTPRDLFFYHLFKDYFLWFFLALTGYGILYSIHYKEYSRKSSEFLAYMIGFFLFTGVVDTLMRFGSYNIYSLFILPLVRIAVLMGAASIIGLLGKNEGRIQWFFLVLLLLLSLPGALAAMMFYSMKPGFAWLVTGLFFSGSAGLFSFLAIFRKD